MKLFNAADKRLGTKIHCAHPCSDPYKSSNVIDSSSNGCLVISSFIRPPISFVVELQRPYHLESVSLKPFVNSHRCESILIEISVDDNDYQRLGRVDRLDQDVQRLVFGGQRLQKQQEGELQENGELRCPLFRVSRFVLHHTRYIRVTALRTLNSAPVALSNLEILVRGHLEFKQAEPQINVGQQEQQHQVEPIAQRGEDLQGVQSARMSKDEREQEEPPPKRTRLPSLSPETSSPDVLLDALTDEPMHTPLILPSGQIVDQSTLQRYNNEEAKWGRHPNDPFTGKLFTSTIKPILYIAHNSRSKSSN